jgi:hypothetical protein
VVLVARLLVVLAGELLLPVEMDLLLVRALFLLVPEIDLCH